jgi:hypothetical protein
MKLTKILESILGELNIPKPEDAYKFDSVKSKDLGYGVYYTYIYTNIKGDQMEITVLLSNARNSTTPGPILYVAFGKYNPSKDQDEEESEESEEEEEKKYKEKTGANDMLKVMATAVEAIKQTSKKIGGMDNVYAISFSPSDKKRKNIYNHYIETLFPDFDKQTEKSYQFSFTKFVNKNFKPKKKLSEIGDASRQPYPFKLVIDDIYEREYIFSTDSGFQYEVEVETIEGDPMEPVIARVGFGVIDDTDEVSYVKQTGENDVYRIMSTITSIVKKDLRSNSADFIEFSPSKRQDKDIDQDPMANVRTQLYSRYIKSQFPNSEVQVDDYGDIRVNLNN